MCCLCTLISISDFLLSVHSSKYKISIKNIKCFFVYIPKVKRNRSCLCELRNLVAVKTGQVENTGNFIKCLAFNFSKELIPSFPHRFHWLHFKVYAHLIVGIVDETKKVCSIRI